MIFAIFSGMAQQEHRAISERTMAGKREKAAAGGFTGGPLWLRHRPPRRSCSRSRGSRDCPPHLQPAPRRTEPAPDCRPLEGRPGSYEPGWTMVGGYGEVHLGERPLSRNGGVLLRMERGGACRTRGESRGHPRPRCRPMNPLRRAETSTPRRAELHQVPFLRQALDRQAQLQSE